MAPKTTHRQAINLLRHLPGYATIFGWERSTLAKAALRWFIAPNKDDDSKKANDRRAFIASYRLNGLSRQATPYMNRQPFISMIQWGVMFDRLLEFAVAAAVNPFRDLPVNGLTRAVWGQWVAGLSPPPLNIQEAVDRFFIERLGPRHHAFVTTSDATLLRLGYLSDAHLEYRDAHRGDRSRPGGDTFLRLTNLAASFPLFKYTKKKVRWGPWDEPNYVLELPMDRGKYVRKCYHFGVTRFERLKLARQMARHLEAVHRYRNVQQEIW